MAPAGPGGAAGPSTQEGRKLPPLLSPSAWLDALKANPLGGAVVAAATRWWAQHPLRLATMIAADATTAVVRPMAQQNPLGLVMIALLLGGALAWSRPWRWLLTPALLAGLVPRTVSSLLALVPAQSWMAALDSLTQKPPPK